MTHPFFVSPYPDAPVATTRLASIERTILGVMVRKPGHTLTAAELTAGTSTPTPSARRMRDHIEAIRAVVGADVVVDVPRRGWRYVTVTAG